MLSETRAILFETQLGWPPAEIVSFRPTKDFVRRLYNALHSSDYNEFAYQNLELQGALSLYSKHEAGGASRIKFHDGHLAITEENSEATIDDFVRRVRAVVSAFKGVCDETGIDAVPIYTQRCKINCLTQPNEYDPLNLLTSQVAIVKSEIAPFGRPPAFFGVRFRFPPVTFVDDENPEVTEELEDFCVVRFETYSEDLTKVWMEVGSARLFASTVNLADDGQQMIEDGIRKAYRFLTENCINFLNQFDKRGNEESGDNNNENPNP